MYIYSNGVYREVNEKGEIEVTQGKKNFSSQWRIVGAVERNNFGHVVKRYSLSELRQSSIEWSYKNGKQKVFIIDYDHGSNREWRSPNHYICR